MSKSNLLNTTLQPKLYGLDHLRAFAIFAVFLFHYQIISHGEPGWLPEVARFGWTGVDLFFVLSGFLISSQLFQQINSGSGISLKNFFLKRAFRIIPAFLVVLGIYCFVPFFREKEMLPAVWKFLTFTQNIGLDLKDHGTFSHAWSLCVEEHFYLVLPFTLLLFLIPNRFKKAYWLIIILFIAGFVFRIISYNDFYLPRINEENSWTIWYKLVYYPTYNRLDGLLVGVSIAAIYQFCPKCWNNISRFGNWFILASFFVLTGAYFLCYEALSFPASVFGFPLVAVGYGLLVIGAISPDSFLFKWHSRVTTLIATLSYAIYLTHKGIIHMILELTSQFKLNPDFGLVICTVMCILAAILLHLMIEKPFMKLRNKILRRETTHKKN